MTSKTFKSAFEDSSYRLEVRKNVGAEHISLWILGGGSDSASIAVAHKDIPALALAILEEAWLPECEPNSVTHAILSDLNRVVELQERITAEAEAKAQLEAEALELFNTLQVEIHGILGPNWVNVTEFPNIETKRKWLAVARRAREINKEDNNGRE